MADELPDVWIARFDVDEVGKDGLIASSWISIRQEMPDDVHYVPATRLTPVLSYQDPDDGEYWHVAHDSGWLKVIPASRLTAAQEQVERLREALRRIADRDFANEEECAEFADDVITHHDRAALSAKESKG